jgi:glucose/mannose-6-phosphate isomerase
VNGLSLAADRLDDPDLVEASDPAGMLRQVASAAAQLRIALGAARESGLGAMRPDDRPRAIVVAGAGVAADLLSAICGGTAAVQVIGVSGYQLPGWVGAADLVVTAGTGEPVQAIATEARRRGCHQAGMGSPGSALADLVRGPFVAIDPRAAATSSPSALGFWATAIPLLVLAERIGIARIEDEDFEDTATALEDMAHQCRPTSESFVNPGKSLALDLVGSLPVIWSASALAAVVVRHLASRLALVAKYPAITGRLPEAGDDQAELIDGVFRPSPEPDFPLGELTMDPAEEPPSDAVSLRLVLVADPAGEDTKGTRLREAAGELALQRGIDVSELSAEGERPLRRVAGLVHLADYTSVYLAIACGVDPSAAAAVGDLRERAV